MSSNNNLLNVYSKENIDEILIDKLGFGKSEISKFNFAVLDKMIDNIEHIEYWILSNAYYDYDAERFVKIDLNNSSFGIQIQASGVYPGEHELGYNDIMGINIWRNPIRDAEHEYRDTTVYDYTDCDAHKYIGARRLSDSEWVEFAVASGWLNNLMTDSFGGVTIGGAGFEIDGNGVYPYTRLSSSACYINGDKYYMLGLLDNAYHGSLWNWDCDSNEHYSWFYGLISPPLMKSGSEVYNTKDLSQSKFVIMYNDTPHDSLDIHDMDTDKWHIIFESSMNSVKGMVNGTLTTLGSGGGGGADLVQTVTDGDTTHAPSGDAVYDFVTTLIGDIEEDMLS